MNTLRVSDDCRSLAYADGSPFFYLGDTAWELFHRLGREEAELYLQDRAEKRFTVIQAVALAEHGYDRPNPYGDLPLHDGDPARPNDAYFRHVDWVVRRANALGLYVALLPTWGDKWKKDGGEGPEMFTPGNARAYGLWLGRRYRDDGVIWVLGGDRAVVTEGHRAVIRAMAAGLGEGDGGAHLKTFHPPGPHSSSEYWPDEAWLDFHAWQTGHGRGARGYEKIASDYARAPTKPVLDAEPVYEDHPADFDWADPQSGPRSGYFDAADVRRAAYGAVFAGACGHTYGAHPVWQFLDPARFPAVSAPRTPWREALDLPGAGQMRHLRALLESRPSPSRIPDQSLLVSDPGEGVAHVAAARASDGSYAFVYVPHGRPVTVRAGALCGDPVTARWYDPRMGAWGEPADLPRAPEMTFTPPTPGLWRDWVLVLDASGVLPHPSSSHRSRGS